jgi:putative transcriptional regulator
MRKKRDLFSELVEGLDALAEQRTGKRTLRAHTMNTKPAPGIAGRQLAKVRR